MKRPRAVAQGGAAALVLSVVALAGCFSTSTVWDPRWGDDLVAVTPNLDLGHLLDTPPFFAPAGDSFELFLCRWSLSEPITVALPLDATEAEREVLRRALSAWEDVIDGLAFSQAASADASVDIVFDEGLDPARHAGKTIADCRLSPRAEAATDFDGGAIASRGTLVHASIALAHTRVDLLGRRVELSDAELAGAAIHELGHALGYAGHARRGGSPMMREIEVVHRWGERVLAGERLVGRSLAALYQLPEGQPLADLPIDVEVAASVAELAAVARERGWGAARVRVGESSARLFWPGPGGQASVFYLADWIGVLSRGHVRALDAHATVYGPRDD